MMQLHNVQAGRKYIGLIVAGKNLQILCVSRDKICALGLRKQSLLQTMEYQRESDSPLLVS